MRRRSLAFSLRVLALLLAHGEARADVKGLVYAAPSECPSATRLEDGIATRSRVAAESLARGEDVVRVDIERASEGFVARVRVQATEERKLSAESCSELVSAISFVVALSLDEERKRRDEAPTRAQSPERPEVPAPPGGALSFSIGLGIGGAALGSRVVPKGDLFLELERHRLRSSSGWEPSVRIAFSRTLTSEIDSSAGRARFVWTTGRAEVCPFRLGSLQIGVRLCPTVELGALDGEGEGFTASSSSTRFWLAAGGRARGELRLFGDLAREAPRMTLSLDLVGALPFTRERFIFLPATSVYRPPAIFAEASLSLRIHLFR